MMRKYLVVDMGAEEIYGWYTTEQLEDLILTRGVKHLSFFEEAELVFHTIDFSIRRKGKEDV
jgi:hypothetical protein